MIILFVVVSLFSKFSLFIFAAGFSSLTFRAYTIHVQGAVGDSEAPSVGILNHTTQPLVAHLGDATTGHTDAMKVSSHIERLLILRTVVKLMADNQMGIGEQLHGVVERSAAHMKFAGIHYVQQLLHGEMPLYGIDCIKDGKTLLRLTKTPVLQILLKGTTYRFLYLIFHSTRKVASKGNDLI